MMSIDIKNIGIEFLELFYAMTCENDITTPSIRDIIPASALR